MKRNPVTNLLGSLITMYIEFPTLHGLVKIKIRALISKEPLGWGNNRFQWRWIFNAYKYFQYIYQATPHPLNPLLWLHEEFPLTSWPVKENNLRLGSNHSAWYTVPQPHSEMVLKVGGEITWVILPGRRNGKLWVNTYLCTVPKVKVKSLSRVRLFATPWNVSPPGSSIHRILQARILEWVAISFSRGSSRPKDRTQASPLQADTLTSEPPGKPYGLAKWSRTKEGYFGKPVKGSSGGGAPI